MQQELAKHLLSNIMEWDSADVEAYLNRLEDFADWKYDSYQQYRPSSRFLENLAIWLNQFETIEEKNTAFEFMLNRIVFISPNEMNHLVSMSYTDIVVPILKKQAIAIIDERKLDDNYFNQILEILKKQIVYLGLSDGARTDIFRRANPSIKHDQVCLTYELPDSKLEDINKTINKEVSKLKLIEPCSNFAKETPIKNLILLDDFSASGISFIRKEEENGKSVWKGKIVKLLQSLDSSISDQSTITIILYISTEKAIDYIIEQSSLFLANKGIKINIRTIQTVQPYTPSSSEEALFKKYYDSSIEDEHYLKGKHNKPYLGFDECSLPVVLYHNTPNNSFPILWSSSKALFPRVARHKEV